MPVELVKLIYMVKLIFAVMSAILSMVFTLSYLYYKKNPKIFKIWLIGMQIYYAMGAVFLIGVFPYINSFAPSNSLLGRIRVGINIYSVLVGVVYLIAIYMLGISKEKKGLQTAIVASVLGVLCLTIPIYIGATSAWVLFVMQKNIQK